MTDLENVVSLFRECEVVFSVSEANNAEGTRGSNYVHYREPIPGNAIVTWEFNQEGKFIGELRKGLLIGRNFIEIFPGSLQKYQGINS